MGDDLGKDDLGRRRSKAERLWRGYTWPEAPMCGVCGSWNLFLAKRNLGLSGRPCSL